MKKGPPKRAFAKSMGEESPTHGRQNILVLCECQDTPISRSPIFVACPKCLTASVSAVIDPTMAFPSAATARALPGVLSPLRRWSISSNNASLNPPVLLLIVI
jgi:hypothetical protein